MTTAPTRRRLARAAAVLLATAVAGAAMPAAQAKPPKGDTARISETAKGAQLNGASSALGLSDDGRFALFTSAATDLLPGPGTPNTDEIYVRDLRNGHVERISVAADGSRLNAPTTDASISGDGRYVAFTTAATNVVPGQVAHDSDLFVRDRWTGRTELIATDGNSTSPSLSRDGRHLAYVSTRTDPDPELNRPHSDVFVTDRRTRTTRLVSAGADGGATDDSSYNPTISADGSTIGFSSRAHNLLPDAPAVTDPGETTADAAAPGLAQPRFYPYYVWKAGTGRTSGASLDDEGYLRGVGVGARISPDGRYALYLVPAFGSGQPGSPRLRMDVYTRELATGTLTRINTGLPGTATTGHSFAPVMTADGRWVYFESLADNLVPGDTNGVSDVFRRELRTGRIERVSLTRDGEQGNAPAENPYVDAGGDTVVFDGGDGNLVPGDTNAAKDVFLRRL
ncbi:TolB family protein [Kitasatospora sp. NPDC091335]|uniref:TolB family protein n=1 Tax=Kitasatospora sp. NPDC091335 TaxID=3364085 RepID=UPI00380AEAF6